MSLGKRVKIGGAYFKGYQLAVNTTAGDYVLHISSTHDNVVNAIQVIPDAYGLGDYVTIGHYANTSATAPLVDSMADTIYNMGAFAGVSLSLPALEPFKADEDLRVTYTNVASTAVVLNVLVEFVR